MCRIADSAIMTATCGLQMVFRTIMTCLLMLENVIRMFLQSLYNCLSFIFQLLSLIPICLVFMMTSRMRCVMCGGGPCPGNRGGVCDCLMTIVALIILFLIFRATGVLDKIFFALGYAKASKNILWLPTPGEVSECTRNDTAASFQGLVADYTEPYYDDDHNYFANNSGAAVLRTGLRRFYDETTIVFEPDDTTTNVMYYLI